MTILMKRVSTLTHTILVTMILKMDPQPQPGEEGIQPGALRANEGGWGRPMIPLGRTV
jgi:hypothetical protein